MIVHRFTPEHRPAMYERVDLDVSVRICRQVYRSHRAAGMRPFLARLCTIGQWCDPETGRVPS